MSTRPFHRSRGFTLIELLVVITIVAMLAGLSFAGMSAMMQKGRQTRMLSQLRQMGLATSLYMADNGNAFPQSQHQGKSWVGSLPPYMGVQGTPKPDDLKRLFRSPVETEPTRNYSYAINDFLTPNPYGGHGVDFSNAVRLPCASGTILFAPIAEGFDGSDHFHFASSGFTSAAFEGQVAVDLFGGRSTYLFADGHVEALAWTGVQEKLETPGNPFVRPDGGASSAVDE